MSYLIGKTPIILFHQSQYCHAISIPLCRSFDCMRIGDQGVKIVKPEDGADLPGITNTNDAIIDAGTDDIEDYDENLVRKVE